MFYATPLPQELPASLHIIRYVLESSRSWTDPDLQTFAETCKLPKLQHVSLLNCRQWTAKALQLMKTIVRDSKANVILEEGFDNQDNCMRMSSI